MNKCISILILVCLFAVGIKAQKDEPHLLQSDTITVVKKIQAVGLPVVFYTPETEFGLGGGLQLFFQHRKNIFNARVSNVFISAIYTSKKQLMLNAKPEIHLYDGRMYLEGDFLYKIFPNSFWGIGNNTPETNLEKYNMRTIHIRATLLNRIPPTLNFGFEYNFDIYSMIEVQEGGLLDSNLIEGAEGARTSGISFVLNFDDRDNIFSAVRGNYLVFKGGFSSRSIGATYSYNSYLLDLRKYFLLSKKFTLATQIYSLFAFGDVPFQAKAWYGGADLGRGYFKGRYIETNYLLVQLELKYRVLKRLHINGFFNIGDVAESPRDLFSYPKVSFGGGLRFKLSKKNPTLIRMDIGINKDGGTGLYFGVNEAF